MVIIGAILTLSGPAVAADVPPPPGVLQSFQRLCADAASGPSAFARADADGWLASGPGAPKDFDPSTDRFRSTRQGVLRLRINTNQSAGEHRDACGVSVFAPTPGLVKATTDWLPAVLRVGIIGDLLRLANERWLAVRHPSGSAKRSEAEGSRDIFDHHGAWGGRCFDPCHASSPRGGRREPITLILGAATRKSPPVVRSI